MGALVGAFPPPAHGQRDLARRLNQRLDTPPFDRNLWGVVVADLDGRILFSRNAERLFVPASNAKLVVTAAATALLPPEWTVRTSLYTTGPVVDDVIQGDVVLYGRGDPAMSKRCYAVDTTLAGLCVEDPLTPLRELVGQLREHGIGRISGNIIGDGSFFEPTVVHPAWEGYDLNWWYAAPVSGLSVNDNSIDLEYGPGATVGAPVHIRMTPDLGTLTLENRAWTSPAGERRTIDFFRHPGSSALWAEGSVPITNGTRTEYFALPDPNLFAAQALRRVLADSGIGVSGSVASTTDSLRYRHARLTAALAEVRSRPVKDWMFPILNTSQNLFAEMLLKQLGRQFGSAGSWREGIEVMRRFVVDSIGVDPAQFGLRDGSGLASSNLISPMALVQILRYVRRHPNYPAFATGLPRSGQGGSLKQRFVKTPLEGRVFAKTGSISRVNTLSGFIEKPDGKTLVFSIMANNHLQNGSAMLNQIDSLVVEMGR